jgi:CheY-specific phosphatase CheX
MTDNLGSLYSEVLTEIIFSIAGFSLDAQTDVCGDEAYGFNEITGVMNLSGAKKSGILFITLSEAAMRLLCSHMIGVSEQEVTFGDTADSLCELVNITAGTAKLRLSNTDYAFNLSSPFMIKSENMSINVKNKAQLTSRVLKSGEINIGIKIFY